MFNRKLKELNLPLSVEAFKEAGVALLSRNGFEATPGNIRLFAGYVQQAQHANVPVTEYGFITELKKAMRHQAAYELIKATRVSDDGPKEIKEDLGQEA